MYSDSDILEIIDYFEDTEIDSEKEVFYHGTMYGSDKVRDILTNGIKSAINLGRTGGIYNGLFYISLSDYKIASEKQNTSYEYFLRECFFTLSVSKW